LENLIKDPIHRIDKGKDPDTIVIEMKLEEEDASAFSLDPKERLIFVEVLPYWAKQFMVMMFDTP